MSCPSKFADLHKSNDDAFKKDFCHGAFNIHHKNKFDAGNYATGECTFKVNSNPKVGSSNSSLEVKATCGDDVLGFSGLKGMVVTKSINDAGLVKHKFEKSCSDFSKTSYEFDWDLNTQSNKTGVLDCTFGKDKLSAGLKVNQGAGVCGIPDSASLNLVAAAGNHNIGANFDYNIKSSAFGHHLKCKVNHDKGYAVVGLKNANDAEVLLTQNVNKSLCFGPFGSLAVSNAHVKTTYGVNNGSWDAAVAMEGTYKFGDFQTQAWKAAYNPKTGDYKESCKVKVSDSLSATIGWQGNCHSGFFKNAQMGAQLNFTA